MEAWVRRTTTHRPDWEGVGWAACRLERHQREVWMAFIVTRINVGNYDIWKTMFDKDEPGVPSQRREPR